jgi:hypothetical protein
MRQYKTEAEKAWALQNDPEYFAFENLRIPAWGMHGVRGIVQMRYTYLQRRVMDEVIWQMNNRGECDLIVVKPRKMRCTSVLNGWEYQQITFQEGLTVLNIAHTAPVAEEIFDRHIKTFHKFMPDWLRREAKTDNKRELAFEENLCKMIVAVAGSNATRGPAASILHLTESGWYTAEQVRDVQQAVFPSVERGPGTARIDESTSAGHGTWQHRRAEAAKNGDSETRLLFISCWEVPEYRMTPPKDWEPNDEERSLMLDMKLDLEQIYWRNVLLKDQFDGQIELFNQEYPGTFELAFQISGGKLINPIKLIKAKMAELQADRNMPVIMGIDPAGSGDRTIYVVRQGRKVLHWESHRNMTSPERVDILKRLKAQFTTENEFIDMGYGHADYDLARSLNMYSVVGIYPGQSADRKDVYANKRTECAYRVKEWIEEGEGGMVSIPNSKEFYEDLAAIPQGRAQSGKLILPPKEEIKKELGGKSPDIFDALSYTFAYRVHKKTQILGPNGSPYQQPESMLSTENTFRELGGDQRQGFQSNPMFYNFGNW